MNSCICCWCCFHQFLWYKPTLNEECTPTCFINEKLTFSNCPKNYPECIILGSWVFDNFMLVAELFAKILRRLTICQSVNKNLWEKLVSSSSNIFDDNLKVRSVACFVANFNFNFSVGVSLAGSRFFWEIYLLYGFWVCIKCLLFIQVYSDQLVMYFKVCVIQKATGGIVITSINL